MANTNRYPQELKRFISLFDSIARRHSHYQVFDDFLDLYINGFCFNHNIDLVNIRSKYSQEERYIFGDLIKETVTILNQKISTDKCFYDVFGSFYEINSLSNKHFGQFFTPVAICRLMAELVGNGYKESFADPASGSGRLSLAANSVSLGMFHCLIDIDYTCAKMSALNLMLHGINGIVICDNGLFPNKSFRGAFIVNRWLPLTKLPQIEYISNVNDAYNYIRRKVGTQQVESQKENDHNDIKEIISTHSHHQYELF